MKGKKRKKAAIPGKMLCVLVMICMVVIGIPSVAFADSEIPLDPAGNGEVELFEEADPVGGEEVDLSELADSDLIELEEELPVLEEEPTGSEDDNLAALVRDYLMEYGADDAAAPEEELIQLAEDAPAAIADTYEVGGVTYFKADSSNFTSSQTNFYRDMLTAKNPLLGEFSFPSIPLPGMPSGYHIVYSSFMNWNTIGREIWKKSDKHKMNELLIDYMEDYLEDSEDVPDGLFIDETTLEDASNMKQAENNMLKLISSSNSDNSSASNAPKLSDLLAECGQFQKDAQYERTGPVFYKAYYTGINAGSLATEGLFAIVFSDFKVSPLLPEETGGTYVSTTIRDTTTDTGTYASDAKNNTGVTANIEQTLKTEGSYTVSSEVNGSHSYTMGHTVSVGIEPAIPILGNLSVSYEISLSEEVQNGWSETQENQKAIGDEHKVSVDLPPYTGILLKQRAKNQEVVTSYNCPVSLSYRVQIFEYGYVIKKGSFVKLADFTPDAQANLKQRAVIDAGNSDPEYINWSEVKKESYVKEAINAMASNVPAASTTAKFTEKIATVESIIDRWMPILPLKIVQMKNQSDELSMIVGDTKRIDTIELEGLNANKLPYSSFDEDKGHWIITNAKGKELTDGAIAKLSKKAATGKITLTAVAPGTVYLKYLIDEDQYGTLTNPEAYATNASLSKTAVIEVTIRKEAAPKVTKIALNKTSAELATNSSLQLKVAFTPSNTDQTGIKWTSSNPKVAKVDANGKVTALAYGKPVTITATSTANSSLKATCKIQTRFNDATKQNVDTETFTAIYWAADNKITGETVSFGTKNSMTRGQFVRFLYRYAGNPTVTSTMIKKYGSKFKDVDKNYTHFNAIVWAVSKGLIGGYSDGSFKPNGTLTRSNVATILWKYAGSPKVSNIKNPFSDVAKSAAIAWGKSKKIFTGTKFMPNSNCLRGDFALFLYRYDKNVGK